jgi:hypothetical protein
MRQAQQKSALIPFTAWTKSEAAEQFRRLALNSGAAHKIKAIDQMLRV